MSGFPEFTNLLEEIRVLHRNLKKDPADRRRDDDRTRSKLGDVDGFHERLTSAVLIFNGTRHEPEVIDYAKRTINAIKLELNAVRTLLLNRLESKDKDKELGDSTDSAHSSKSSIADEEVKIREELGGSLVIRSEIGEILVENKIVNMGEKFDLKAATGLLPVMNDTEAVTKQLIDAIEMYDCLLDDAGKKLLTMYVLKTRLSQAAKIRLQSTYTDNKTLVEDMRNHLLTKKSPTVLSVQLNSAKQGHKTINEFGKSIEELMVNLTIAQADGDNNKLKVFREANEKIALNAFANGLRNNELRTIIQARGYSELKEAIRGAQDAEQQKPEANIFHFRDRRNFTQRNNTGRYQRGQNYVQPPKRGYFSNQRVTRGTSRGNYTNSNHNGRYSNNRYRGQWKPRGNHRTYYMGTERNGVSTSIASNSNDASVSQVFFRDQTQQ